MSRLPVVNLCLITLLVTLLAMKQSLCSLNPALRRSPAALCDRQRISGLTASGWHNTFVAGTAASLNDPSLWRRAQIFTEWLMEYNTVQWQKHQANNNAESDLVEARFHVANAEVFEVAMQNRQRAEAELSWADRFLEEAGTKAGVVGKHAIAGIEGELRAVRLEGGGEARQRLDAVKFELDGLIKTIHFAGV